MTEPIPTPGTPLTPEPIPDYLCQRCMTGLSHMMKSAHGGLCCACSDRERRERVPGCAECGKDRLAHHSISLGHAFRPESERRERVDPDLLRAHIEAEYLDPSVPPLRVATVNANVGRGLRDCLDEALPARYRGKSRNDLLNALVIAVSGWHGLFSNCGCWKTAEGFSLCQWHQALFRPQREEAERLAPVAEIGRLAIEWFRASKHPDNREADAYHALYLAAKEHI